jgi:hypothetical protein
MLPRILKFALTGLILCLGLVAAGRCRAQDLPAAPVPVLPAPATFPAASAAPAAPLQLAPVPLAPVPPPPTPLLPPACAPYEDRNGPLLRGDPLLDCPDCAPPGWYASVEASILVPHIKNRLTAPVTVDGITDQVHLPTAELDVVGSPRVELGYRFDQGCGEVVFAYRSLVSEGSAVLENFDVDGGEGLLHSRLNVNVFDIDYGSREYALGPCWDMRWRVGARVGAAYFDSRAVGAVLEQRTSNNFVGGGPHVGLDLRRTLGLPGLSAFGRLEGSALLGRVRQSFEETFLFDDGTLIGGATNQNEVQAVPVLDFEAGLMWTAPRRPWLRFGGGYQLQSWWYLGTVGSSHAQLTSQGAFFRVEWGF